MATGRNTPNQLPDSHCACFSGLVVPQCFASGARSKVQDTGGPKSKVAPCSSSRYLPRLQRAQERRRCSCLGSLTNQHVCYAVLLSKKATKIRNDLNQHLLLGCRTAESVRKLAAGTEVGRRSAQNGALLSASRNPCVLGLVVGLPLLLCNSQRPKTAQPRPKRTQTNFALCGLPVTASRPVAPAIPRLAKYFRVHTSRASFLELVGSRKLARASLAVGLRIPDLSADARCCVCAWIPWRRQA